MKRILILAIEIIIVAFSFSGCIPGVPYELYDENEMSRWTSQDGNIDIYFTRDRYGYCVIKEESENLLLFFKLHGLGIYCYEPDAYFSRCGDYIVSFSIGNDFSKRNSDGLYNKFVVTVYGLDYYKHGEKIVFDLIDRDLNESEVLFVYPPFPSDKPLNYPLSKWVLSDKSASFYIDSDGLGCGYIDMGEEMIPVYCTLYVNSNRFIELVCYDISTYCPIEEWTESCLSNDKMKNQFQFYVYKTTYYEKETNGVIEIVADSIYVDDVQSIADLLDKDFSVQ